MKRWRGGFGFPVGVEWSVSFTVGSESGRGRETVDYGMAGDRISERYVPIVLKNTRNGVTPWNIIPSALEWRTSVDLIN